MRRRYSYRMEWIGGENNISSQTSQAVFGRRGRKFVKLRNYHLISEGRARKRYGYTRYVAPQVSGANPIQGLAMYEFGSTRYLVVVCNGAVKVLDENTNTFTAITGALSLTAGQNVQPRFGFFNNGTNKYLLAADGVSAPWAWAGAPGSPAVTLESISESPLPAGTCLGVMEFHGYPLFLTASSLAYAKYGTFDWINGGTLDGPRDPLGIGMAQHSRDVALIFYQNRQVYRLEFNPLQGTTWRMLPIDQTEGCISAASIVTKDGYTYYAGRRGIFRIGDPERPADFIGREIQGFWGELCRKRRPYITAISRGEPFDEVMWLVTYGSTGTATSPNDCIIVWNTQVKGWTIFPVSATSGKMNFNCGVNWVDQNDLPHTIMGGYDGYLYDAFGHALVNTTYADDGAAVATTLETGYLNFDYPGVSGQREIIIDGEFPSDVTFTHTVEAMGETAYTQTKTILAGGDLLDVDFILDESVLSETTPQQDHIDAPADGRYIKNKFEENGSDAPHTFTAFDFPHVRKGLYAA